METIYFSTEPNPAEFNLISGGENTVSTHLQQNFWVYASTNLPHGRYINKLCAKLNKTPTCYIVYRIQSTLIRYASHILNYFTGI